MKRSKTPKPAPRCGYPKRLNRLFSRFFDLNDMRECCQERLEQIEKTDPRAAEPLRARLRTLEHLKDKTLALAAAGCRSHRTLFAHFHPIQALAGQADPQHPAASKWKRYQDFISGKIPESEFSCRIGPALRRFLEIAQYPSFHDSSLESYEPAGPGWAIVSFRGYFSGGPSSIFLLVPDRDALFLINKIPYKASLADALGPGGASARSAFSRKIHAIASIDVLEDEWSLDAHGVDRLCLGLFRQKNKAIFEMQLSVRAASFQKHELVSLAEQDQLQAFPAIPCAAKPKPRI